MTTHHTHDLTELTTPDAEPGDRWARPNWACQSMLDELTAASQCPVARVLVVPWIGHREPGDAVGDGGLAEVHQSFRAQTGPSVIYMAAPVVTDLPQGIARHLLAHELGHVARHGRLHTAVDTVAALAVWPVVAAAAAGAWSIGARGPELFLLPAVAWAFMRFANWAWELLQEIQADDFATKYSPLSAEMAGQLWSYLDTHLGTGLGARYRGYRLIRNARRAAHRQAVLESLSIGEETR